MPLLDVGPIPISCVTAQEEARRMADDQIPERRMPVHLMERPREEPFTRVFA